MTDPTLAINFATAFPDWKWDRVRNDIPTYWHATSMSGREVILVATIDELESYWLEVLFGEDRKGGRVVRLRSAIGTPPF